MDRCWLPRKRNLQRTHEPGWTCVVSTAKDTSIRRFGIAGVAHHEFADATDLTHSVARAADGRVYLGGWTRKVRGDRGWLDMAIFAVDAQGGAVATFGDGGLASFDLANPVNAGGYDGASALAVMPDGRLLVGGFSGGYY